MAENIRERLTEALSAEEGHSYGAYGGGASLVVIILVVLLLIWLL